MNTSQLKEYNKTTNKIQNLSILLVDVKEKLSELVRRRINELDLTNAELARRVGRSRGYIGNIVNETAPTQSGQYNLSPKTVKAMARELQISESEILEAMHYLSSPRENVPLPILDAIGSTGELSENDTILVANFIKMLKTNKAEAK